MKQHKPETAIILASEITKGMKSIGSKSLLPLDTNITAIDHQIQYLKKYYNPIQIILCTGFDHDKINNHIKKYKNIECCYNPDYSIDNQAGSLVKCLTKFSPKNAFIITNGLLLFDKIKIEKTSATYFIDNNKDRRSNFDIGTNTINSDGYLFYDLLHKWIEVLFLESEDIQNLINVKNTSQLSKLFLFELINYIKSKDQLLEFIKLNHQNIYPIKINSIKDLVYAKKYYKKYKPVSN